MSLPNAGTWASSNAILQTQNTAPVREFRCLYTSDIRRKQKRWQDGRLKYHTFNKRIMVYDDRSNFVGDSHWREDHAFGEGQEVELERCGICVEVSECVGTREQDLTPLLNKVVKDRQERAHVRAVASSTPRPPGPSKQTQIVGISRADSTELRSAKRRKPDNSPTRKNGYAQNITGATLALSGTPSTAAPLRYDPAWSRTMKRSIEEIVMSESAGIHRMPQQRPVPINISHTKTNGSRTKNLSKKSPPALLRSGHAQNNTGAALVLASKTLTCSNLLSASGTARKVTTRLGNSHSAATTIEEDEFIDIDFYDEENLLVERTMTSPKVTNPAKNSQEKPLLNVHSHQTRSEGDQPERPFNPLRIRTRPKRKLLSAPSPPSRSPSLTELSTENGNRAVCPSTAPGNNSEPQGSLAPELQVASVTETGPPDVKGRRSPPQVNAGMDHYGIDVLLTRKAPGQSSIAKDQHAEVQSRTKNIIFTQCAERSNTCTGFEGQQKVLSKLTPGPQLEAKQKGMQSPRQLFMLRANIDTDIDKACVSIQILFLIESLITLKYWQQRW